MGTTGSYWAQDCWKKLSSMGGVEPASNRPGQIGTESDGGEGALFIGADVMGL